MHERYSVKLTTTFVTVLLSVNCWVASSEPASFVPTMRDDKYSTCHVFYPGIAAPWDTDVTFPISYLNNSLNVSVELVGTNVGCSIEDDGKLYVFPISSWNESSGLIPRRKTCVFNESSAVATQGQQRCMYRCLFPVDSVGLRVIRLPNSQWPSPWTLCEVSSLFYENKQCHFEQQGGVNGQTVDQRTCWVNSGRMYPTGFGFVTDIFLVSFEVYYGNVSCRFTPGRDDPVTDTVYFETNELITEVLYYRDPENTMTNYEVIVGMKLVTNTGKTYGVFGAETGHEYRLSGQDLLYFFGLARTYVNGFGVQFGKC